MRKPRMYLLVLLSTAMLTVAGCGQDKEIDPEQQIRDTLSAIEAGVEERSMSAILEHVSTDYADHQGFQLADVKRLIQVQLIRNQKINLFTYVQSVSFPQADLAAVELSAAMSGVAGDLSVEKNRLRANTYHFSLVFRNEDDQWQVSSASWKRGWQ